MPGQGDIIRGKPRDTLKSREKQRLQAVDNRMDIHRDDMCVNEKFFGSVFLSRNHPRQIQRLLSAYTHAKRLFTRINRDLSTEDATVNYYYYSCIRSC